MRHWFDGLAMLHRFAFADGRVTYANRFLRSRAFQAAERDGRLAFREFATDPCRSAFKRISTLFDGRSQQTDNGAVNIARLGDEYLALTETPLPVAFDPRTLETIGVRGEPPADLSTAHPTTTRSAASSSGTASASARAPPTSSTPSATSPTAASWRASRVRRPPPALLRPHPSLRRHLRRPVRRQPPDPRTGRPALHRELPLAARSRAARFWLVDRDRGGVGGPWTSEPFFCFHTVNTYEQDGDVVIDLVAYDDASVVHSLGLGRLRAGEPVPAPDLRRFRLPLRGPGPIRGEALSGARIELPRIDYRRRNGRPYRTTYGIAADHGPLFGGGIVKLDVVTGEAERRQEPGAYAGEPVYVPRPGAEQEDDGVLLSVVLEPDRGASSLLVLDAGDLSELARARVPHHIPFGFHGQHFGSV